MSNFEQDPKPPISAEQLREELRHSSSEAGHRKIRDMLSSMMMDQVSLHPSDCEQGQATGEQTDEQPGN